jgi:hypothetical protein
MLIGLMYTKVAEHFFGVNFYLVYKESCVPIFPVAILASVYLASPVRRRTIELEQNVRDNVFNRVDRALLRLNCSLSLGSSAQPSSSKRMFSFSRLD